eukprot:8066567-Pyramimonas_sp.AAC.1
MMQAKLGGRLPSTVAEFMYSISLEQDITMLLDQGITDLDILLTLDNHSDLKVNRRNAFESYESHSLRGRATCYQLCRTERVADEPTGPNLNKLPHKKM